MQDPSYGWNAAAEMWVEFESGGLNPGVAFAIALVALTCPEAWDVYRQSLRIRSAGATTSVSIELFAYQFFYHLALALYGMHAEKLSIVLSAAFLAVPYGLVFMSSLKHGNVSRREWLWILSFGAAIPIVALIPWRGLVMVFLSLFSIFWINQQYLMVRSSLSRKISITILVRRTFLIYFLANIAYIAYGAYYHDPIIIIVALIGEAVLVRLLWLLYDGERRVREVLIFWIKKLS